ncbi:MAG: MobH family relaxase [Halopseudomonas sp.]
MLRLFKSRKNTTPVASDAKQYQVAKSGADLLRETEWRVSQVRQIKRLYSVTDKVWEEHYLSVIERFSDYAQGLPASEIHHHSRPGGLLDHTLECLLAGSQIAQGYMLPPNAEPEQIAASSDKWRFAALVAILTHDLGKIVTDIEVVYRKDGGTFQPWHPWLGVLPLGCEYAYRFKLRAENAGVAKSLHEKASVSLLPQLLTDQAVHWLFSDPELLAQLISTINHAPFGGGAISEVVRLADRSSVGNDLGAGTGVGTRHSMSTPLHEKLVLSLRKLIADGDLKQNRPGAAIWITQDHTWAVSKKVAEAMRDQLISEGHKGIPQSALRIFSVLQDHGMIVPNPGDDPVWQAEIQDHERSWNQKLTFLRFENKILWSTGYPKLFDGDVVPVDAKGSPLKEKLANNNVATIDPKYDTVPESSLVVQAVDGLATGEGIPELEQVSLADPAESISKLEHDHDKSVSTTGAVSTKEKLVAKAKTVKKAPPIAASELEVEPRKRSGQVGAVMFKIPEPVKDAAADNDFLAWLVDATTKRKIRVNEPKALVHVTDQYIALVSPGVFVHYLRCNPMRKKSYEIRSPEGTHPYKLLQRELEALGIHKSTNGQNICKVKVTGAKKQSELSCYLIHKRHLPSYKTFSANKAISIP